MYSNTSALASSRVRYVLRAVRSVFSEEKKLSIAAWSKLTAPVLDATFASGRYENASSRDSYEISRTFGDGKAERIFWIVSTFSIQPSPESWKPAGNLRLPPMLLVEGQSIPK